MTPRGDDADRRDHERWREDLPAYALGALDGADAVALEAHLAGCERCSDELRWFEPAVAALPASVPQLEAPRRLRRRTMQAARADVSPASSPSPSRPWLVPAVATAAAVAVVLAIGVRSLGGHEEAATRTVAVEVTSDGAPGTAGTVVTDGGQATLEVEHLPRLPRRDVYQAWLQRGDQIEPSTTFIVDRDGHGAAAIPAVDGAERIMVTREPRGGSEVPSTAPLLQATLGAS